MPEMSKRVYFFCLAVEEDIHGDDEEVGDLEEDLPTSSSGNSKSAIGGRSKKKCRVDGK